MVADARSLIHPRGRAHERETYIVSPFLSHAHSPALKEGMGNAPFMKLSVTP